MTGGDNGDESGDAHGAISGSNSSPGSDGNQPSCVICIPKYQRERIKRILELRSALPLLTSEHIRTIGTLEAEIPAEEEQMQQPVEPEVEQAYFVDNREFKATTTKMLG